MKENEPEKFKETYFLLKNEKLVFRSGQNAYSFDGDKFLIGQDTSFNLPSSITVDRQLYRSKNILSYQVSENTQNHLEKFYKESLEEIGFYSLTSCNNYLYLNIDIKDIYNKIK